MMLYSNTKVKVRLLDRDTDFFDMVAGVLLRDTLAPYRFIICVNYVLRTSIDLIKENGFTQKKKKSRSRRYSAETVTDADYTDTIVLRAKTPTQAESLLHSLEQAAGGIGLYVDADKIEYMYFNQEGDISTLNGGSLRSVDKFTYLSSCVSSAECDIYGCPVGWGCKYTDCTSAEG